MFIIFNKINNLKKDFKIAYFNLFISIIFSIIAFFLVYKNDKITAFLIALILLTKPIKDVFLVKQINEIDSNYKIKKINVFYKKIGFILYFISFIIFISIFLKPSVIAVTFTVLSYIYASFTYEKSTIKYSSRFLLYNNKLVLINNISKIDVDENKMLIHISNFDKTTIFLKFKDLDSLKIVYRILKRK